MFESRPKKSFRDWFSEIVLLSYSVAVILAFTDSCSRDPDQIQVIDGFRLLTELKMPAEIWLVTHPRFPNVTSLLRKTGDTDYIKIGLESDFSYSATFLDKRYKPFRIITKWKLVLSYDPKTKTWGCIKNTTVPEEYLPSNCLRK